MELEDFSIILSGFGEIKISDKTIYYFKKGTFLYPRKLSGLYVIFVPHLRCERWQRCLKIITNPKTYQNRYLQSPVAWYQRQKYSVVWKIIPLSRSADQTDL